MRRIAVAVAVVIVVVIASGAAPAVADPRSEAVVLFDQGIKDMKAGRLDKACAELQASLELVKDSGTKGALATCHGRAGRIASAWVLWGELSDTAPTAALRASASAQAARLEPRLPRYTLRVARPTPELVVEINGRRVAATATVAMPIDPGKVSVTASQRDGKRAMSETWTGDYTAVEGQTLMIDVPELVPRVPRTSGPPSASTASASPASRGSIEHPGGSGGGAGEAPRGINATHDAAARRRTRRIVGLALGGVGLGAAAVGTVFALTARSRYGDARQLCGGVIDQCDPAQVAGAQALVDDARRSATLSTVMFSAAGAAVLAGAIVWLTAPSPEVGPGARTIVRTHAKAVVVIPVAGSGSFGLALGSAF